MKKVEQVQCFENILLLIVLLIANALQKSIFLRNRLHCFHSFTYLRP